MQFVPNLNCFVAFAPQPGWERFDVEGKPTYVRRVPQPLTYKGVEKPFEHQRRAVEFHLAHSRGYNLSDPGTGKTFSAVWAAEHALAAGVVDWVLVVAPLSTLREVWQHTIACGSEHDAVLLLGTAAKRRALAEGNERWKIINHDGVEIVAKHLPLRRRYGVIVDESTAYKNARSTRSLIIRDLCQWAQFVWALTGTPAANAPTDAFGQCKLVTPHTVPKYLTAFKQMTMEQKSMWKWVPKPAAPAIVARAMQPSFRVKLRDCIDLPPETYSYRELSLSPEQQKAYKALKQTFYLDHDGGQVVALNNAAQIIKLIQVSCGLVYGTQGALVDVDTAHRAAQLRAIIDEIPEDAKYIVFSPFNAVGDHIARNLDCARVNGQTPERVRADIFARLQRGDLRGIVAEPRTMSHGLTLTAANYIVWAAPIYDNEVFQQANARIVRPGQKNPAHIIMCYGVGEERQIYKQLARKEGLQQIILNFNEY